MFNTKALTIWFIAGDINGFMSQTILIVINLDMCGLDVTHKAFVTQEEAKKILNIGTEFALKVYDLVTIM